MGLLDRDYYFDEDKADKRAGYQLYIQKVFSLLGDAGVADYHTEEAQKEAARLVFQLETSLAGAHLTRTASRDPELTYNKMSLDGVTRHCQAYATRRHKEKQMLATSGVTWAEYLTQTPPILSAPPSSEFLDHRFSWEEYFKLMGKDRDELGDVNVSSVSGVEKAYELMCLSDGPDLQHYLVFHTALSFSDCHLPMAFKEAHFEFYEKMLKGTMEMKPRWKSVLAELEVVALLLHNQY